MYHCDQCPNAQRYFAKHSCFFWFASRKIISMGIVILDYDAATVKGPITSVFVIDVGNHLNSKTLKRKRTKGQLVGQGRSHMPTLVCRHQGTDLPQIAEATVCTVHIQKRSYSSDEASRRNQLSLWNSRSKTIKPFGLNTGNHQQCQVMQLCIDMIYHPCAGYLFSISRSALSRKTARVYPHFAGLTFADNCEEEVRSTDWHIGWRGPLLESFYFV